MADHELSAAMARFEHCVNARERSEAEDVLDEGFALVLVQPALAEVPRHAWLDMLGDYIVHSWELEEQHVDVDGEVAAVLQRVSMRATVLGQDRSGTFVLSDIWRSRADGWKIWRRHSTPLSAGPMPADPPTH